MLGFWDVFILHPLAQNDQIRHGNTLWGWACFRRSAIPLHLHKCVAFLVLYSFGRFKPHLHILLHLDGQGYMQDSDRKSDPTIRFSVIDFYKLLFITPRSNRSNSTQLNWPDELSLVVIMFTAPIRLNSTEQATFSYDPVCTSPSTEIIKSERKGFFHHSGIS